jgi:methylthioribose-1-phosphate isomerase
MQIRGAPAIASLAALSFSSYIAQALQASPQPEFLGSTATLQAHVTPLLDFLFTARPTAVNLGAATRRLSKLLEAAVDSGKDPISAALDLVSEGRRIADEDVGRNKAMSKWGAEWLVDRVKQEGGSGEKLNVLTVCNTGSLATSVSVSTPAQLNLCLLMPLRGMVLR